MSKTFTIFIVVMGINGVHRGGGKQSIGFLWKWAGRLLFRDAIQYILQQEMGVRERELRELCDDTGTPQPVFSIGGRYPVFSLSSRMDQYQNMARESEKKKTSLKPK